MEPVLFQVLYHQWEKLAADCNQQLRLKGIFLRCKTELPQFTEVMIRIITPAGTLIDLKGQIIQQITQQGLAIQFDPGCENAIQTLCEQATSTRPESPTSTYEIDPEIFVPGQVPPQLSSPKTSAEPSSSFDLEQMTVDQKRSIALRCRATMRMLLIRDRNKTIHPFVIKNPAITLDEIEQIAKMPSVNPDVLRTIAKSHDWSRSQAVCRNLVKNPKTPLREALLLLQKLPISDIRALAKSSNVRTAIQQVARKIINQ